jgi:hypothetical protein
VSPLELLAAAIVGILSVARTARLVVWDEYPPMIWLRDRWDERIGEDGWGKLIHCQFCATPYMAVVMFVWGYLVLGGVAGDTWSAEWWWWAVNGVWGGSYLAAIVVAYDQPED